MTKVIIASPSSPLRRSSRLADGVSTGSPSGEKRVDAVLSPLRLANEARSPVRRVYSPRAHSPTGRPPPVPKSAVRTKLQLRNRSGNVTQNSASSPSGLTDHSTRQLDGRQSKSWDNIGWLLVITISFLLAAYALQLDLNSTPRTTEDGEGPVLVVRQASESIQNKITSYSDRVKKAKELQEKNRLSVARLREESDQFIMRLNAVEALMGNVFGAEGLDGAAVIATRVLKAQSDLQEVQMAAVSSLSEVNAKLEVQRSFVIDKALELHNLVKQLQTNGTNTFGPRMNALEKETNYLVEFFAMNEDSINLLKSVIGNTATQENAHIFVSELHSGAVMNDNEAHLALPEKDDILEALRSNVTHAVQEIAKDKEEVECVNIESADQLIRDATVRLMANRTGQKDFARRFTGGRVVYSKGFTSPTYYPEGSGFLIRMLHMVGADMRMGRQEEALSSDMRVGSCWAMAGQNGRLTVQLSEPIRVTAVTIQHVSARMTPDLSSAPREFMVFGIQATSITSGHYPKQPRLLIHGRYDVGGPTVQVYQAELHSTMYEGVSIHILSNHGHDEYTCLYSFKVHGLSGRDMEIEKHSHSNGFNMFTGLFKPSNLTLPKWNDKGGGGTDHYSPAVF